MRYVFFKDKSGKTRRTLVREEDGDEMAEFGLPAGPPDIEFIDWEALKVQVHNALVGAGAYDLMSLQRSGVLESVGNIFKRHVQALYRDEDRQARTPDAISQQE